MLRLNVGDATGHIWVTCFHESAEKLLQVKSDELADYMENDKEKLNTVFTEATFKTFNFRMRVKQQIYNDQFKVSHTLMGLEEVNHEEHCRRLIKEIEEMGGKLPGTVSRQVYL